MSLQSERLLNHMLRLRLSHLPNCYGVIAEEASAKDLPYLDFLEQTLEAESQAKHTRNVRLKTHWAHFPYNKGLDQFDFAFQPSAPRRANDSLHQREFDRGRPPLAALNGVCRLSSCHLWLGCGALHALGFLQTLQREPKDTAARLEHTRTKPQIEEFMQRWTAGAQRRESSTTFASCAITCHFPVCLKKYTSGVSASNKT